VARDRRLKRVYGPPESCQRRCGLPACPRAAHDANSTATIRTTRRSAVRQREPPRPATGASHPEARWSRSNSRAAVGVHEPRRPAQVADLVDGHLLLPVDQGPPETVRREEVVERRQRNAGMTCLQLLRYFSDVKAQIPLGSTRNDMTRLYLANAFWPRKICAAQQSCRVEACRRLSKDYFLCRYGKVKSPSIEGDIEIMS